MKPELKTSNFKNVRLAISRPSEGHTAVTVVPAEMCEGATAGSLQGLPTVVFERKQIPRLIEALSAGVALHCDEDPLAHAIACGGRAGLICVAHILEADLPTGKIALDLWQEEGCPERIYLEPAMLSRLAELVELHANAADLAELFDMPRNPSLLFEPELDKAPFIAQVSGTPEYL